MGGLPSSRTTRHLLLFQSSSRSVETHGSTGAAHIVALANSVMALLEYGASFCANRVVLACGVHTSLLDLGAGQFVCWLSAVTMYVFEKRVRSFVRVQIAI